MLEMTLATKFVPGTNLAENMACADWRYLLPSLHFNKSLCIGTPSLSTLEVLSSVCKQVYVISQNPDKLQFINSECRKKKKRNIQTIVVEEYLKLSYDQNDIDLIYICDSIRKVKYFWMQNFLERLKSQMTSHVVVYFEITGYFERILSHKFLKYLKQMNFMAKGKYWLTPMTGNIKTASPVDKNKISLFFFSNVLFGLSFKMQILSTLGKIFSRLGIINRITPRHAFIFRPASSLYNTKNERAINVPKYLSEIAEKSEISLSKYTFGLNVKGKYNSNKVIFFLFNKITQNAEIVVKMTRSSEFNYRLENEYKVLNKLREGGYVEKVTYPEPVFFGYHNNLAVLAIKAIHGMPFRTKTQATGDCPVARDAIQFLYKLGTASANNGLASTGDVSTALSKLFNIFIHIYELTEMEQQFMMEQINSISQSDDSFPLVFQHGDPGTWNMMVSDNDKVRVIDWEAGEIRGMPLWDLFYFFRSYGSWIARQKGGKNPLKNFADQFLDKSEINILFVHTVHQYCNAIKLEKKMIKPLFYCCWMHRALKEATRLKESSLQNGQFLNLLKMCIREQNNPSLLALFGES